MIESFKMFAAVGSTFCYSPAGSLMIAYDEAQMNKLGFLGLNMTRRPLESLDRTRPKRWDRVLDQLSTVLGMDL